LSLVVGADLGGTSTRLTGPGTWRRHDVGGCRRSRGSPAMTPCHTMAHRRRPGSGSWTRLRIRCGSGECGQATCRYSWTSPPRTSTRSMRRICSTPAGAGSLAAVSTPRPMPRCGRGRVVVHRVVGQHPLEVTPVEHQDRVQALSPHGAHPALRAGVGLRRPRRNPHYLNTGRGAHRVEAGGELAVPIPDEQAEPTSVLVDVPQQIAGRLGNPSASGWAVTPVRCTRRRSSSITKNTYSRVSRWSLPSRSHTPVPRPPGWDRRGVVPGRGDAGAG
jgi:hypothetical protein